MKHRIPKTLPRLLAACAAITALLAFPAVCAADAVIDFERGPDVVLGRLVSVEGEINLPYGACIDHQHGKVYVVDNALHRVLRFSLAEAKKTAGRAEAVFGRPELRIVQTSPAATGPATLRNPSGACVDAAGNLWVADTGNHRVLRFNRAWARESGSEANTVLGQVNFAESSPGTASSRMNTPHAVAATPDGTLYVADTANHRVLRFPGVATATDAASGWSAAGVTGQYGFSNTSSASGADRLKNPTGLSVFQFTMLGVSTTWLWVADSGNHRVLCFTNPHQHTGGQAASKVLGQADFQQYSPDIGAARMRQPLRVEIQNTTLWVADSGNNRVLRFDGVVGKPDTGAAADGVLGQGTLLTKNSGDGRAQLNAPHSLAAGQDGSLWICDSQNHRVIFHQGAAGAAPGRNADAAIGASGFSGSTAPEMAAEGLAIDPVGGQLFVADTANNRILRYSSVEALQTGAAPVGVLGQVNFQDTTARSGHNGLSQPRGLCLRNRALWVADSGNQRVLRFDAAYAKVNGASANFVIGQPDLNTAPVSNPPVNSVNLSSPRDVFCYNNLLVVADWGHHRVLGYKDIDSKPNGSAADLVWGQSNFASYSSSDVWAGSLNHPRSVCLTPSGHLLVADESNHRVLGFRNIFGVSYQHKREADYVIGQPAFNTKTATGSVDGLNMPRAVRVDMWSRVWTGSSVNRVIKRFAKTVELGTYNMTPEWASSAGNGVKWNLPYNVGALVPDPKSGGLWVSDVIGKRVLYYAPVQENLDVTCGMNAQGKFYLSYTARIGNHYIVESSTDLIHWEEEEAGSGEATSTTMTWVPPQPLQPNGGNQRYFRVSPK